MSENLCGERVVYDWKFDGTDSTYSLFFGEGDERNKPSNQTRKVKCGQPFDRMDRAYLMH
jgi:hypothetical protein